MPDDVHRDAGERDRRRESDAECDHAHVLEARVGEQTLPGERPPQERDGDGEREESEAHQHERPVSAPTAGSSARSTRQATSSTAGRSAAESSADTGGGASE